MQTLREMLNSVVYFLKGFSPDQPSMAWWVRIHTRQPEYTYYFGPFDQQADAEKKLPEFIGDLRAEAAIISQFEVLRCSPPEVTIKGNHQPLRPLAEKVN